MDRATVMPEPIKPLNKFLPDVCRTADILVVAVGHPELVSPACGCPSRLATDECAEMHRYLLSLALSP